MKPQHRVIAVGLGFWLLTITATIHVYSNVHEPDAEALGAAWAVILVVGALIVMFVSLVLNEIRDS